MADQFGYAVTAGNFGKTGQSDIAVGIPGEARASGVTESGAVAVLYGTPNGVSASGNQLWDQNSPSIMGMAESGDAFGSSLAAWNFGKSTHADLAIGVPGEAIGAVEDAGGVHVFYGTTAGLAATGSQFWQQGLSGILDTPEQGDQFGFALNDFGAAGTPP
jgi:hypothetical protein